MNWEATWGDVFGRIRAAYQSPGAGCRFPPGKIWGIPRGGAIVAGLMLGHDIGYCGGPFASSNRERHWAMAGTPEEADYLVDDIYDSGATAEEYEARYGKVVRVLFDKSTETELAGKWVRFPWEHTGDGEVQDHVRRILEYLGEDPSREGLRDTPARYLRAMLELAGGAGSTPAELLSKVFPCQYDELVVVRDLPFHSLCEHHMLPFSGHVNLGYLAHDQVLGLSKLARLVAAVAGRLQIQERMTVQLVDGIMEHLKPRGAGVIVSASHSCMRIRGVRSTGQMVTSALRGDLKSGSLRAEFLDLASAPVIH